MTEVFGYLTFALLQADAVALPDGTVQAVPAGQGGDRAAAWNAEHVEPREAAAREAALAAAEAARTPAAEGSGPSDAEVTAELERRMERWTAEMEAELERRRQAPTAAFGSDEGRRRQYLLTNPQPSIEDVIVDLGGAPPPTTDDAAVVHPDPFPRASTRPGEDHWHVTLESAAERFSRIVGPGGPVPRAEVVAVLDELGARGWSVVHVSEERVAHHTALRTATVCVAMSFLLRKAAGAAGPASSPRP